MPLFQGDFAPKRHGSWLASDIVARIVLPTTLAAVTMIFYGAAGMGCCTEPKTLLRWSKPGEKAATPRPSYGGPSRVNSRVAALVPKCLAGFHLV